MTHHTLDLFPGALVHYGYWAVAGRCCWRTPASVPGETVFAAGKFSGRIGARPATGMDCLWWERWRLRGRQFRLCDRELWRASSAGAYRNVFRIRDVELARGEKLFETVWLGPRFILAIRFRNGSDCGSASWCAAHAMEKVCGIQLSGSGIVGERDFACRIFFRRQLANAHALYKAV